MADSATDHLEVRWRVQGSDEAWSLPAQCDALGEIVVVGLDHAQQYEFEARAVSNCGAKSAWVDASHTVPDAPAPPDIATLTATSVADGVALAWTVSDTPPAGIEYLVERSADQVTWTTVTRVRALGWTDPDTSGTLVYYRVHAVNFNGTAGATSPVASGASKTVADGADVTASSPQASTWLSDSTDLARGGDSITRFSGRTLDNIAEIGDYRHYLLAEKGKLAGIASGATVGADWESTVSNIPIEFVDGRLANGLTSTGILRKPIPYTIRDQSDLLGRSGGGVYTGDLDAVSKYQGLKYRPQEPGPNLLLQSTFTNIGKWINEVGTTDGIAVGPGNNYLYCTQTAGNNPSNNCNFFEDNTFPASAGDVFHVSGVVSAYGSSHTVEIGLQFLTSSGGVAGYVTAAELGAGISSTTLGGIVVAPSGSASARMWAAVESASDGDQIRMYGLRVERSQLMQPGSRARLGDLRNQVAVGVGNYASGWDDLDITYSATSSGATITASTGTLRAGSVSLPYNGSSTTVSGTGGTTVRHYLYYDDPDYAGGSRTLHATTSQITALSDDGRVLVGQVDVTFPTSGTGGGGSSGGCVSADAWVVRRRHGHNDRGVTVRAHTIGVGDELRVIDPATGSLRWGRVSFAQCVLADRVTVVIDDDVRLTCSYSAPLGGRHGAILAPDSLGAHLASLCHGRFAHRAVRSVTPAQRGNVMHITCENTFFLAGDLPTGLLAHHNMKPGP